MVGVMGAPPRSIPAAPLGRAAPWGLCRARHVSLQYLRILLGELSDLLLGLGHVMPQQEGARGAPVLQQWGEGVGVPWEHPQTMPLQDGDSRAHPAGTAWQQAHPASVPEGAGSPARDGCWYLQLQLGVDLWPQQAEQVGCPGELEAWKMWGSGGCLCSGLARGEGTRGAPGYLAQSPP